MKQFYQKVLTLGLTALLFFTAGNVMGQVFITELADPNNDAGARYVELYNAGATDFDLAANNYALIRYTNGNTDPQSTPEGLTGTIPAGGYYIIAVDGVNFAAVYGIEANQSIGAGGPADSNGDDQILLIDTTNFNINSLTVIDIFGVPGEDGSGTGHEFEDGRAERLGSVTGPNSTWDVNEWDVDNDSGGGAGAQDAPAGFDPGAWIGDANAAEFANFTPSVSNILEASFDLTAELNERSNLYYVVLADGETAPTASEVKAGTGNGGASTVTNGNFLIDLPLSGTETVTGLTASTSYDVYVVAEDLSGNLSVLQPVIDVTTTANVAPSITGQTTATAETTSEIVITVSESVTVTDASGFSVSIDGAAATITNIAGSGTDELTLTLSEVISKNSGSILLSFDNTLGNVSDGSFNLESETDLTVTNNTTLNIVANIEDARALASGELVQISGEVTISFIRDNEDEIYVQDATRGIVIVDDNNQVNTTYAIGEGVTGIKGTLNIGFTEVLEFIPTADLGAATSTGTTVTPDVITITEFNTNFDNYESRIITIEEVGFANAGTAFDDGGDNYNIGKDGDTTIFRDNFFDFRYESDMTIPYGRVDITGIAGQFQGDAQIVPNSTTNSVIDNYSPVTDEAAATTNITTSGFDVTIGFDEPAKVKYLVNTNASAAQGDVLASANVVQQNDPSASATINVTGQPDNTEIFVHMVATDTSDANPQSAVTTVSATTLEIVFDATSNIVDAETPIDAATISSVQATTEANAVSVFNFTVVDSASTDAVPTEISSMVITNTNSTAWSSVLAGAKITDGNDTVAVTSITDTELGFDFSTPFIVENGGDTTFTLIVWFNESVQDGTPIQFEIPSSHSFVSNNTGSAIINTLDAAVTSATHTIDVVATDLVLRTVPTSILVGEAFGFAVTAEDVNGNVDTAARALTASATGTGTLGGSVASTAMTNGELTYADLVYDVAESFTVTITDGSLSSTTASIEAVSEITGTLFFSEYIEGSSNNKALEIYNATGTEVALSEYRILRDNNGTTDASDTLELSDIQATLAAGEVLVIANPGADQAILDVADVTSEITFYNGNDALRLFRNNDLIDHFGNVGEDPTGGAWAVAGEAGATAEKTLVRKSTITEGNPTALASFGTDASDSEWIVNPQNDFSNLGFFGEITDPVISANTTGFNGSFGFVANGSSSDASSYSVSAQNLTEDLVITAPVGFELSLDEAFSSPSGSLNIAPTAGDVAETTIYVRFTPTAADGADYSGDITHTSAGAESVSLQVSGTEGELALSTIAEARAAGTGSLVKVRGVVVGGPNNDSRNRAIMDPTAGITLFSFDFPTGDLVVGDSVEAEGNVSEFRGLLQLQPTKEITIISQGVDLPTPKVISLAQVGDDFESQLVTVEGVRFVESGNFEGGTNYRIANNAGDTLAFRVGLDNHPLVDTAIPTDYVDVTGTIGQFDDFQLTVESTDAIVLAPKEPILEANVEGNGFDFGSVEAGTQSAAQSFTVSGENLTEDVSVTVPAGYELSLAETTGFDSAIDPLIIDQAGVLVETTIYVRFAPDAAVTGVISGEITLASGDLSEVVAVTGTATEPTTTANKAKLEGVKAYPNPTATFINVEIADNTKEFTYQVVALDGSVLVNGKAFVSERIDISAVETGMYILEITQGQKAFVTRIVKH